jgi:hypothetical protein
MAKTVHWFLALQVVVFGLAALLHAGVLTSGYEHREATIAETVIGMVLFAGLLVTLVAPRFTRRSALLTQGFALLGTLVGVLTMVIGVGPRTSLDIAIHATMLALLAAGLVVSARRPVRSVS